MTPLNVLPEQKTTPLGIIFLHQFKSSVVILLLFAAVVSLSLGDQRDTLFIFLIILANAGVGFYQEAKAKKEIAALKKLVTQNVRVIRNNVEQLIDAKFLVPGDEVLLFEGDKIPADGIITTSQNLATNEAALTGESVPVDKIPHDRVYMGTAVISGRGKIKITVIGAETKFGQIALSLSQIPEEKTPLEIKLTKLGNKLTVGALIVIVFVVIVGFFQQRDLKTLFFSGTTLAVSAIPEGLPAIITIALAVGMARLAKRKAIIKRLVATETLGSVDVILCDKTGTLTKNEMTVKDVVSKDVDNLLLAATLCNTSSLADNVILGDTTEGALLVYAQSRGLNFQEIRDQNPLLEEVPFDSVRKMMTVATGKKIYTKGAPEKVIPICNNLSAAAKENYLKESLSLAAKGLRILAFAQKNRDEQIIDKVELEKNLHFLGLIAIADPPRPEVKETILACQKAGIATVMITGDSPETAKAIGREIGLLRENKEIVTGDQLHLYSDEILDQNLLKIAIFARATPADKLRIVQAYQRAGKIVAVTGDGVNDAPALKKAEIGVAMGLNGTDVAKEAADMVITDDNFTTIVAAVEEGRIIFANLLKTIKYLLSTNLSEVVVVSMAMLVGLPLPLSPSAILWINVATDGLPALALAIDPKDGHVLTNTSVKSLDINWKEIILIGSFIGSLGFLIFTVVLPISLELSRLLVFSFLVIFQIFLAFIVRGRHQHIFGNKILILAVAFAILSQALIIVIPGLRLQFI